MLGATKQQQNLPSSANLIAEFAEIASAYLRRHTLMHMAGVHWGAVLV